MSTLLANLSFLQAGQDGGSIMTLVSFGLIILIMYFMIFRPQMKQRKDEEKMRKSLEKGDKVVTIGGIRGTIKEDKEETIILTVDENVTMEFNRNAIASVIDKKTKN